MHGIPDGRGRSCSACPQSVGKYESSSNLWDWTRDTVPAVRESQFTQQHLIPISCLDHYSTTLKGTMTSFKDQVCQKIITLPLPPLPPFPMPRFKTARRVPSS